MDSGHLVELQSAIFFLTGRPTFCGEWSMALPWKGRVPREQQQMNPEAKHRLRRHFVDRQINSITRNGRLGGYWWTWYAPLGDTATEWNYEYQLRSGVIRPGQWAAPPAPLLV